MESNIFLNQMNQQIYDAFVLQDPELYDTVFEIEEKKLYAEKVRLSLASPTFKSMLSNQWHQNKNEAIKIETYKYDDFKELLNFIYSGKCKLTNENIFAVVDIAEFYQVPYMKELCDEYLSKMDYNSSNIYKIIEILSKYSLSDTKTAVGTYVTCNYKSFVGSNQFLNARNASVHDIVALGLQLENIFEAVYKWAEYQAQKKQKEFTEKHSDYREYIKAEISEFLPYFDLTMLKKSFIANFLVDKTFIFSDQKAVKFLKTFNPEVKVKITNSYGQTISGTLSYKINETAIGIIQSLQNRISDNPEYGYIYWDIKSQKPSISSCIKRSNSIKWYLIYFDDGDIGLKRGNDIYNFEYLITEMTTEKKSDDFVSTQNSFIEIIE